MELLEEPLLALGVNLLAIALMAICLSQALRLRARVPGGLIKRKLDYLFLLVLFFAAGYLVPPFLGMVPDGMRPLLVSVFSVFGAVYVFISVKLLDDVIRALAE
ncbi:hypothetical protein [Sedimenticola hydrogenitrophicus]|jgi:hypothetical protein|uniref:hypothetical protein n=1 Tax=Sedimenticola hydrogenitrophicus TaxID=2967975 RepID=UPI0021A86979|nr:hypothetical protein [Sedimenticola hydrogenitrophicus]